MLIFQAIIEAPNQQLNLCDIFAWFQANFLHFRSSNLTWKVNELENTLATTYHHTTYFVDKHFLLTCSGSEPRAFHSKVSQLGVLFKEYFGFFRFLFSSNEKRCLWCRLKSP